MDHSLIPLEIYRKGHSRLSFFILARIKTPKPLAAHPALDNDRVRKLLKLKGICDFCISLSWAKDNEIAYNLASNRTKLTERLRRFKSSATAFNTLMA